MTISREPGSILNFAALISPPQRKPKNTEISYWIVSYLGLQSITIALRLRTFIRFLGQDIGFTFLKRSNEIPYFFKSSEINKIFDLINNIKHLAMFKTAFYACLRASELCNLDVEDINLDKLALVVRNGKGGKTAVCYLSEEAIEILREYLAVRPDFELEGRRPLFFHRFWSQIRSQGYLSLGDLLQEESWHQ